MSESYKQTISQQETEISLLDIVNFLADSWKKIAIASIIGVTLGLLNWFLLVGYSAEYLLLNNTNSSISTNTNTNTYGLDLLSWKIIQKSLPNLASQIVQDGKEPVGQSGLYKTLASDQWWQKNAIPTYALSRADTKNLAGISKALDGASTTILSVAVSASGSSEEDAVNAVRGAAQFLRSGGAYLQIRSMLNGYEGEVISAAGEIRRKISSTKIEIGYQQQRAKSLEELYKRYPTNPGAGQQVIDPKESGAKYLSMTTQIIAANNDINQSKELLLRLDEDLAQLALLKFFLDEALPKAETTFDGLVLGGELLAIEEALRTKVEKNDSSEQEILDQIRSQLLVIQARFTKGLEANTGPTSSKKGVITSAASGLAGGFFLALILLLGERVWSRVKRGDTN